MRHHTMQQLTSVRPADLAPGCPVDPATRDRELAAAFRHPAALRATGDRRLPDVAAMPRLRRRRLAASLGAAAAAVVAVALILPGAGLAPAGPSAGQSAHRPAGDGHHPAGAAPVSARQILLAAAQSTAAESTGTGSAGTGSYWFTDLEQGTSYVIHGRGGRYVVQQRGVLRDWTYGRAPSQGRSQVKSGSGTSVTHYRASRNLGVRPYGAANVAAWRRDGSPASWPALPGWSIRPAPWVINQEQTSYPASFNDGSLAQLRRLPTSPARLRAFFLAHPDGSQDARQPGQTMVEWLVTAAVYLLESEPVPARVRAAAFRMLSGLPGIRNAGPVTDPLGRRGTGILLPPSGIGGCRIATADLGTTSLEVIVDPAAGRLLATEVVVARPGTCTGQLPAGGALGWTALRKATWTSHPPRHAVTPPG